ncbi:unnamed protein product [Protopolystoma xenopodis]|uniref:Uncharacterized protein n=1 Tax=Protopolystoma xenopodis TaxID=117903 RepID=A0A448WJB5_9PLAT|nr:unnamed protein product [Protopolystoma xenopodis]
MARLTDDADYDAGETSENVPSPRFDSRNDHAQDRSRANSTNSPSPDVSINSAGSSDLHFATVTGSQADSRTTRQRARLLLRLRAASVNNIQRRPASEAPAVSGTRVVGGACTGSSTTVLPEIDSNGTASEFIQIQPNFALLVYQNTFISFFRILLDTPYLIILICNIHG